MAAMPQSCATAIDDACGTIDQIAPCATGLAAQRFKASPFRGDRAANGLDAGRPGRAFRPVAARSPDLHADLPAGTYDASGAAGLPALAARLCAKALLGPIGDAVAIADRYPRHNRCKACAGSPYLMRAVCLCMRERALLPSRSSGPGQRKKRVHASKQTEYPRCRQPPDHRCL